MSSDRRRTYLELLGGLDMKLLAKVNTASSSTYTFSSAVDGFLILLDPNTYMDGAFAGALFMGSSVKFHANSNNIYTFSISDRTITYVKNASTLPSGSTSLPSNISSAIDSNKPYVYIFGIEND